MCCIETTHLYFIFRNRKVFNRFRSYVPAKVLDRRITNKKFSLPGLLAYAMSAEVFDAQHFAQNIG